MDAITLLLFKKIESKETLTPYEISVFIIVIPLLTFIIKQITFNISYYFSMASSKAYNIVNTSNEIRYQGSECIEFGKLSYRFPSEYIAINHWVRVNNKYNKFNSNHSEYGEEIILIDSCINVKIDDDIYLSVKKEVINKDNEKAQSSTYFTNVVKSTLILSSNKRDISKFVENCVKLYDEYVRNKNKNKLFHFIYLGTSTKDSTKGDPEFSSSILRDLDKYPNNGAIFNNLVNEHTEYFRKDIEQLKDEAYYEKFMLKRKKGYLFAGPPGCGKTSTVNSMAIFDNRHVIEISLSRIKTNIEFEKIMALTKINGIEFEKHEVVLLFDEIDRCIEDDKSKRPTSSATSIEEKASEKISERLLEIPDKFNMGIFLSKLDGIGNYDGLIIVATTNNKDKLDPALYRDLRLTLIEFDYLRYEDIIILIKKYYDIENISQEDISSIPDRSAGISPAKLMNLMERNKHNIKGLFDTLKVFKKDSGFKK